jgi:hypothetical protein
MMGATLAQARQAFKDFPDDALHKAQEIYEDYCVSDVSEREHMCPMGAVLIALGSTRPSAQFPHHVTKVNDELSRLGHPDITVRDEDFSSLIYYIGYCAPEAKSLVLRREN